MNHGTLNLSSTIFLEIKELFGYPLIKQDFLLYFTVLISKGDSIMGICLIRISVIYLFIGTALGMYMSITEDFDLSSVHTHISLIGWTTMTLAGIIYYIFLCFHPSCDDGK